ncbi:MAG: PEP-CTERM sorting domain-containing protein [Pseudomonadota bacterium]
MIRHLLVAVALSYSPAYGATAISLADFDDPLVEDFESVALGSILETDPVFTALSITGITTTSAAAEPYDARSTSTRALGATDDGTLTVVDPGTSDVTITEIGFDFSRSLSRIGFGIHDSQGTMAVDFLDGTTVVDSIDVTITQGGQLTSVFLMSDLPFTAIDLSIDNGFVIDNLTVEAAHVPVPATLPLLLLGLAGIGYLARQRSQA